MAAETSEQASLLSKPSDTSTCPQKSQIRLYYELNRLHKFPAGSILVFWPCAWALAMVAYRTSMVPTEFLPRFSFYAFASTLVHSTACVINDICDRDFDRLERTKTRPLASGAISLKGAIICLLLQLATCIAILSCVNNTFKFAVGFFGIFPLHGLYPLMKRYTNWPQAWLGLTMNWGFVVVWVILFPSNDHTVPAVFFTGTICWTMVYDTIYGCQDKKDDVKAGVKSTSLLFGDYIRQILSLFACGFVGGIAYAGYLNQQGWPYYVISVGGTSLHLLWQLGTLKPNIPADCWEKFTSNGNLGLITFAGMVADYLRVSPQS
ncbi:4-hydroxybenzoate polyprenyltransferase, mitochondrial [Leucoagaricus sp. SymC.cos]|nr:4-hydroxybenzoate polyprenyltransferase, mitochondrial [Leucoagaricus sp. SymC.cos]